MNGRQSLPRRKKSAKHRENAISSPEANEMPSYQNKSLDMSVRLELWRTEKRKQQLSKEANKSKQTNSRRTTLYYTGSRSSIPLTKTTKLLNKKFKTPVKEYRSPSIKDTHKDTELDMRTRLELWWKDKGKTSQTSTLSRRGFLKTPVGTTPIQRRKTMCCTEPVNRSKSVRTSLRSGILKHGDLSGRQTRKSCSFILRDKENLTTENVGLTPTDSFSSHTGRMEEEEVLTQSLERCYELFNPDVCTQEEIVFSIDDIQREFPNALRHALYWICRARLAEDVGDHEKVVCMMEQAYAFSAQPKELIKAYFDEYKSKTQIEDNKGAVSPVQETTLRTPYKTPSRELSKLDGEIFHSSVVRFCLIDSTPVRNRGRSASEKRVLTPVRRTTRWERCGITRPKTIEENRITVASLDELSSPVRSTIVYKPNLLLPCQLDEEMRSLENIDES